MTLRRLILSQKKLKSCTWDLSPKNSFGQNNHFISFFLYRCWKVYGKKIFPPFDLTTKSLNFRLIFSFVSRPHYNLPRYLLGFSRLINSPALYCWNFDNSKNFPCHLWSHPDHFVTNNNRTEGFFPLKHRWLGADNHFQLKSLRVEMPESIWFEAPSSSMRRQACLEYQASCCHFHWHFLFTFICSARGSLTTKSLTSGHLVAFSMS